MHAQHTSREWTNHAWDSWKQVRVSVASARGYHKSPEDFFDAEFHGVTQANESNTWDHNNLTAPRVLCNNNYNKSDDNKKKIYYDDVWSWMTDDEYMKKKN
jgi:hypothetical protein